MQAVNLTTEVDSIPDLYMYQKVGVLNGHILSVVNVENRTLDFHIHEDSDELFYVIEGEFRLEIKADGELNRLITVRAGELIIVPKGVSHRPVVTTLAKFLMAELAGTLNRENSGPLYEE